MLSKKSICLAAISSVALAACGGPAGSGGGTREVVRAVGSSTVYPFATAVAEKVGQATGKAPVIESTGTGAGMKLFCAGVGISHPDIENASRRMKASEYEDCVANGVTEVVEIQVGIDGIASPKPRKARTSSSRRPTSTRRLRPTPTVSPIRPRPGRTSTRPCPRFRSWSTVRLRPPARATRLPS